MKTLMLLLVLSATSASAQSLSPQEGCKFSVNGQLYSTDKIEETVPKNDQAIIDADHSATQVCVASGWSDCSDPVRTVLTNYYGQNDFKFQYAATVTSSECVTYAQENWSNSDKVAIVDGHYVRLDHTRPARYISPLRKDCEPSNPITKGIEPGNVPAVNIFGPEGGAGTSGGNRSSRAIPGDEDYGLGRNHRKF